MAITVLVIDFGSVVRAGIDAIFQSHEDIEVQWIDSAENDLRSRVVKNVAEKSPDVVLTDASVEDVTGAELIALVSETSPGTAVVILSTGVDSAQLINVIKAGARGYLVLSEVTQDALVAAVRQAAAGGVALQGEQLRNALDDIMAGARQRAGNGALYDDLTARELQVLNLLANGYTNQEIADRLSVSVDAVKNNVSSLAGKLGSRNRAHTAVLAERAGLIGGDLDGSEPAPED